MLSSCSRREFNGKSRTARQVLIACGAHSVGKSASGVALGHSVFEIALSIVCWSSLAQLKVQDRWTTKEDSSLI